MTIIEKVKEREAKVLKNIYNREHVKRIDAKCGKNDTHLISAEDMIKIMDIRIEALEAQIEMLKCIKDPDYFNIADVDAQIAISKRIKDLLKMLPD